MVVDLINRQAMEEIIMISKHKVNVVEVIELFF